MLLDIDPVYAWGCPPAPLLPAPLRRLWGGEQLPVWLADELRLPRAATYRDLSDGVWEHAPNDVSHRVLTVLSNLLRARLREAALLHCVEFEIWPDSVVLTSALLSRRTTNALRAAGLFDKAQNLLQLTFGDLLRIPAIGSRSALEFACIAEALLNAHGQVASKLNLISPSAPLPDWTLQLADTTRKSWVDFVSKRDPRFAALIPRGEGTLTERIERCLAEPTSLASIVEGTELSASIARIQQEVIRIEQQSLEESLVELLNAGSKKRRNQVAALVPRFGWSGEPPQTLEGAAKVLGLTRERVRQIEERFLMSLPVPIFLPKLDAAIDILERAAPLPIAQAEQLLVEKNICANHFSVESLLNTARILRRETDLAIDELRNKDRIIVASRSSGVTRTVARTARKLAGMAGVASVFQVTAMLVDNGQPLSADEAKRILSGLSNIEFLNEDWFWAVDLPVRRNRLSNITKKVLSVASPQSISSIREGVRRAFLYRSKTKANYESLTTPPTDVLAAFFKHSPEFKVEDGHVTPVQPLNYLSELGEVDKAFVDVLRSTVTGVLDRRSIMAACLARGLNENSVSLFLTYSAIVEHVGVDIWKLRGVRVDPAAIEALREANASVPAEQRLLSFGWRPDGKLWIASRLPYTTSSFVLGVPGSIKRYLSDRIFAAFDRESQSSCGQIAINESGNSFGYSTFFRLAGADPGDVVLAEFDFGGCRVELSLVEDLVLETEALRE